MRAFIIIILILGYLGCSSDVTENTDDVSLPPSSEDTDTDTTTDSVKFVAVGNSGTILTSSDGTSWTSPTSGTSNDLKGVTYANSTFVAVGKSGTILTSTDGTS